MSFRGGGGGMLSLFEISKKWPFRKGMGWGGGGGIFLRSGAELLGILGFLGSALSVCTCCLCPAPCVILLSRPLFVAQVHFFVVFVRHNAPQSQQTHFGFP